MPNVARAFGTVKLDCLARFDWTSLLILSRETVPQLARDEALARARKGENINKERAEEIVARCRCEALPDPDTLRLVSRVFDVLGQLEKHHDRLAAPQRDRLIQRLISAAYLLSDSSPEYSPPPRAATEPDVAEVPRLQTLSHEYDVAEVPRLQMLSHEYDTRSTAAPAPRAATVRERLSGEPTTIRADQTAPSRSRLDNQPADALEPAAVTVAEVPRLQTPSGENDAPLTAESSPRAATVRERSSGEPTTSHTVQTAPSRSRLYNQPADAPEPAPVVVAEVPRLQTVADLARPQTGEHHPAFAPQPAGETPAPQIQQRSTPLTDLSSSNSVQPVARAAPSRRGFLAAVGSAIGAIFLGSAAARADAVQEVAAAAPRARAADGSRITSIHGPNVTVFIYDPSGRLISVTEHLGPQAQESKSG